METILIIAVILTALTVAVPLFLKVNNVNREQITQKKLEQIKQALIGNPNMAVADSRTQFGFCGDTGVLPGDTSLGGDGFEDLFTNDAAFGAQVYPVWVVDTDKGIGYGWRGPYLDATMENGQYLALLDGWGHLMMYRDVDTNPTTWDIELRSAGPNGVFDILTPVDDIFISLSDENSRSYVTGTFRDTEKNPIDESQVTVFYPAGVLGLQSIAITTDLTNQTYYDSETNTVTPVNPKLPIGIRYFETADLGLKKLGVLNHGDSSIVNFVALVTTTITAPFWERTFYKTDKKDSSGDYQSPLQPLMGNWVLNESTGDYYAEGSIDEYRAVFGLLTWDDYRIEVNATLYQDRGYGIYYRSDLQTNITGYCFQYDPGLNDFGGITFAVRKVIGGTEDSEPFKYVDKYFWDFPYIFNSSHHTSITVQGTRHIIKVDGNVIFDFEDSDFPTGGAGLRSWDGQHFTDFHSLLVYDIPPLETGEIVWWSFEEGDGNRVYGSGFNIDANEINGTIYNLNHAYRFWPDENTPVDIPQNIHGQTMYFDGTRDANISFGDVLEFSPTDEFSISAWVRIDYNFNAANEYVVIAKNQNGNLRGWKLALAQYSSYDFGTEFTFQESSNGRNAERLVRHNTKVLEANKWYHIMVTYQPILNGSNIDPESLKIFVTEFDNSIAQNNPDIVNIGTPGTSQNRDRDYLYLQINSNTTNNQTLYIGSQYQRRDNFHGAIDEVRIYNHALTYNEVNDVFQKEK